MRLDRLDLSLFGWGRDRMMGAEVQKGDGTMTL
jgi:hypothetical protein